MNSTPTQRHTPSPSPPPPSRSSPADVHVQPIPDLAKARVTPLQRSTADDVLLASRASGVPAASAECVTPVTSQQQPAPAWTSSSPAMGSPPVDVEMTDALEEMSVVLDEMSDVMRPRWEDRPSIG